MCQDVLLCAWSTEMTNILRRRTLAALHKAADLYELLEAYSEAAKQHHLAAIVADDASHVDSRNLHAAAFLQMTDAAESAAAPTA